MKVSLHINDLFSSVCYRIGYTLFDPGDEWDGFKGVDKVLLTHAHFDHIYGLNKLVEVNPNIKVYTNEYGRKMLLDAKMNLSLYHETPFVLNNPESIVVVENNDDIRLADDLSVKQYSHRGIIQVVLHGLLKIVFLREMLISRG